MSTKQWIDTIIDSIESINARAIHNDIELNIPVGAIEVREGFDELVGVFQVYPAEQRSELTNYRKFVIHYRGLELFHYELRSV